MGKNTSLTDDRIAALDEIGFEWVVVRRSSNAAVSAAVGSDNNEEEAADPVAEADVVEEAEQEVEEVPETVGV